MFQNVGYNMERSWVWQGKAMASLPAGITLMWLINLIIIMHLHVVALG